MNSRGKTISVVGYASLLSEENARQTVPNLRGFRLVTVPGFKRIFSKVGIVFFQKFEIKSSDRNIASCATRPASGTEIIASRFECSEDEFLALYEREHRFRWVDVDCIERNDATTKARMCTEYNDSDYLLNKCVTEAEYDRRVRQYYADPIWRDDILPFQPYLEHCLEAARAHGDEVLGNFLRTSYLADGITTLETYLGLAAPRYKGSDPTL